MHDSSPHPPERRTIARYCRGFDRDHSRGGAGQLARNRGARVVGTESPRNHEHLAAFGATPIDYTGDWEQAAIDAEIAAAQDLSAAGHVRGKLLLEIVPQ
ncbi:hypothetical protein [Rhodococcus sp. AG1013]|uniref:hypothetical protein n=1 Tax=unclassified Rhodococcus (in: high G+C Gram-positive bacteria) TaxID=192944 RepID=UPI000E0AEA80|nr:hypothetical protein [Rhodococcus sp. AG1013]RDI35561.1 hypothetical protein DEU38_10138 [Rhodococcus sp. AG1013]